MTNASLQLEGAVFPTAIPPHFEQFYRSTLRHVRNSRLRARDLNAAYDAWASKHDAATLTFAALKKLMAIAGHRQIQSNGVHYEDVGLASAFTDLADNLPTPFRGVVPPLPRTKRSEAAQLVAKVDHALRCLLDLRRALLEADEAEDPAGAASRVVGLFDQ